MSNLLTETREFLTRHDKTPGDVRWVGVIEPSWLSMIKPNQTPKPRPHGSWQDFERFADFEYNGGYGCNEVEGDLVIVGDDWWLERGEYDGSEWWEFKTIPRPPNEPTPLRPDDLRER